MTGEGIGGLALRRRKAGDSTAGSDTESGELTATFGDLVAAARRRRPLVEISSDRTREVSRP